MRHSALISYQRALSACVLLPRMIDNQNAPGIYERKALGGLFLPTYFSRLLLAYILVLFMCMKPRESTLRYIFSAGLIYHTYDFLPRMA